MLYDVLVDALRASVSPIAAVYALAALGLNLQYGFTGLLNFGQAGFMLLGAYGVGITVSVFDGSLLVGLLVAFCLSLTFAALLGLPTLRLRADYLAISTIAAAEGLRLLVRSDSAAPLTGGVFGLQRFADSFYSANPFPIGSYSLGPLTWDENALWILCGAWLAVALSVLVIWTLLRSPWGRILRSIRDDENVPRALGKNVFAIKMQSLALGGLFGTLGGALLALAQQTVTPDTFYPELTFFVFAALILGGQRTLFGPIIGAVGFWFIVTLFDGLLRWGLDSGAVPSDLVSGPQIGMLRYVAVGIGLMLIVVYAPNGLAGMRRKRVSSSV